MRATYEMTPTIPTDPDAYLSWPELRSLVPLSRPQVWRLRSQGQFPAPRRLSPNRVAWRRGDILAWLASRQVA